jgi:hypothetical protein
MEVMSKRIYFMAPYGVFAGKMKPDDEVHYLVKHEEYGVVEFESEILPMAIGWVQHFAGELTKFLAEDTPKDHISESNIVPFNKH